MKNQNTPISELDLPEFLKKNLEMAGVKTVHELGELPIDVAYEICNKEMPLLIKLLKQCQPFV